MQCNQTHKQLYKEQTTQLQSYLAHCECVWAVVCVHVCECMSVFSLKIFQILIFGASPLLCMLRLAPRAVIPLILSGIDETNDLTVTEQLLRFDLRVYETYHRQRREELLTPACKQATCSFISLCFKTLNRFWVVIKHPWQKWQRRL